MSEKRHRQQQQRQRRKAQRPSRSERDRRLVVRGAEPEIADLLAGIAKIAARDAHEPTDALDAEQWASSLIGTMHARPMPGEDVEGIFLPGFVDALERLGTPGALAALRALGAVTAPEHAPPARAAGDRLARAGLPEPPWAGDLSRALPTAAALMYEAVFDDGLSVMVEYTAPGVETHTVGIYIDHNMAAW